MYLLTIFIFSCFISAAPLLVPNSSVSLDPEKKEPLPKFEELKEFEVNQVVRLESLEDQKVTTFTQQRLSGSWKQKDELVVSFLDFVIESKMTVPGFGPFNNKQDLKKQVQQHSLTYRWKGKEIQSVSGVKELREKVLNANSNSVEKATLGRVLQEDLMKGNASMFLQWQYCLEDSVGKKIGESWKAKRTEGSTILELQCKFLGWGKWKDELVAKLEVKIPLQKNAVVQSTGKKQTIENEGDGEVYWVPSKKETLSSIRQKVRILGDKGSVSYSSVVTDTHHYSK